MGRILLAHASATGLKQYLSAAPFPSLTPSTVTTSRALAQRIRQAREEDLAVVLEEFSLGGSGAAAPIRDAQGQVVGALNVATVTSRFEAHRQAIIDALRKAAEQITQALGHPGAAQRAP